MPPSHRGPAKRSVDDLAVFGGSPLFREPLHVGRPNLGDRAALHRRLDEVLDSRWLTNDGRFVEEFEKRLRDMIGVRHVIAVTNATTGLGILARAMGLSGEVIVPSFTFIATAHALSWLGLRPVFCDIDPDTLTIDPEMVTRLIGPDTSAILGVHLWGRICDTDRLERLAADTGIPVIYDAAHAFACSRDGRMAGTFGAAEVLSFHATKVVNTFEGGAICTDDDAIAATVRSMRNFGISDWDQTDGIGTNGKMHEMSAAMGLASLDAAEAILATNHRRLEHYARLLEGIEGIRLLSHGDPAETNAHYVIVRVGRSAALSRDQLLEVLVAEGVFARRYFHPGCHRLQPYSRTAQEPGLPVTDALSGEVLALPNGTAISEEDIAAVCELIRFALGNAGAIRRRQAWEPMSASPDTIGSGLSEAAGGSGNPV